MKKREKSRSQLVARAMQMSTKPMSKKQVRAYFERNNESLKIQARKRSRQLATFAKRQARIDSHKQEQLESCIFNTITHAGAGSGILFIYSRRRKMAKAVVREVLRRFTIEMKASP